jgi:hypothetical protein
MANVITTRSEEETVLVEPVKDTRIHILFPLLNLLRSRKFIVAVSSLVASVVVSLIPAIAPYTDLVVTAIIVVASVLIGGISFEDALVQGRIDAIGNEVNVVGIEVKEVLRVALEEKLKSDTLSEEEKEVLRDLLERLLKEIPEGQVALKV